MAAIDRVTATIRCAPISAPTSPCATPAPIMTNANSPPGPSSSAISRATARRNRTASASAKTIAALTAISPNARPSVNNGRAMTAPMSRPGADRHEEQAEQQALEGLDRHLDLAPVFGFGEQKSGDECAERHRQAGRRRHDRRAHDDQQARGHEEFRRMRLGDLMEQRPQQQPAGADDERQRGRRGQDGEQQSLVQAPAQARTARAEHRHHEQQGRDHQVLRQQHGEGGAAGRRSEPATFDQRRDDDGRRRQGESAADDEPGGARETQRENRDRAEGRGAGADLQRAEAEHQRAQAHQPFERQFETDHEQQEHHAELCERRDFLAVFDPQRREPRQPRHQCAHAPGSDGDAGEQETDDRRDPYPAEQRHDDAGRRQEQQGSLEFRER